MRAGNGGGWRGEGGKDNNGGATPLLYRRRPTRDPVRHVLVEAPMEVFYLSLAAD